MFEAKADFVTWEMVQLFTIIMVLRNQMNYAQICVDSILKYTDCKKVELILIDEHSTDGTTEWLATLENEQRDTLSLKVRRNESELGYANAINSVMREATGSYVVFLDPETIVTDGWLDDLYTDMKSHTKMAAIGPKTNFCYTSQSAATNYHTVDQMHQFAEKRRELQQNAHPDITTMLDNFCIMVRRQALDALGHLDDNFTLPYFCLYDVCLKLMKAGFSLGISRKVFVHHFIQNSHEQFIALNASAIEYNNHMLNARWSVSALSDFINWPPVELVPLLYDKAYRILDVDCGSGERSLKIKSARTCHLTGMPTNEGAQRIAEHVLDRVTAPWGWVELKDQLFDAIILDRILQQVADAKTLLDSLAPLLSPDGGVICAVVDNAHYYKRIDHVLGGHRSLLDRQLMEHAGSPFTLSEVIDLFQAANYQIDRVQPVVHAINQSDVPFFSELIKVLHTHAKKHLLLPIEQTLVIRQFIVIAHVACSA